MYYVYLNISKIVNFLCICTRQVIEITLQFSTSVSFLIGIYFQELNIQNFKSFQILQKSPKKQVRKIGNFQAEPELIKLIFFLSVTLKNIIVNFHLTFILPTIFQIYYSISIYYIFIHHTLIEQDSRVHTTTSVTKMSGFKATKNNKILKILNIYSIYSGKLGVMF